MQSKITVDQLRKNLGTTSKPNKFRNRKTVVDGITFDSKAEATRYKQLKSLEGNGKIKMLARQVPFVWTVAYSVDDRQWTQKQKYIADFVYIENEQKVVEDVKGFLTAEYRRKRKIMAKLYGIKILETGNRRRSKG
jgi:Protein of unknown function (DUF1064)